MQRLKKLDDSLNQEFTSSALFRKIELLISICQMNKIYINNKIWSIICMMFSKDEIRKILKNTRIRVYSCWYIFVWVRLKWYLNTIRMPSPLEYPTIKKNNTSIFRTRDDWKDRNKGRSTWIYGLTFTTFRLKVIFLHSFIYRLFV